MNEWATFAIGLAIGAGAWAIKDVLAPDFLDTRRQQRTAQLQREAEMRSHAREDQPVRRQIAAALLDLVKTLRQMLLTGNFSVVMWQHVHSALEQRVECDAGARALGAEYQNFVDALRYDAFSIGLDELRRLHRPADDRSDVTPVLPKVRKAHAEENIATALLRLVPLMRALGIEDAQAYEESAMMHVEIAHRIYRDAPNES